MSGTLFGVSKIHEKFYTKVLFFSVNIMNNVDDQKQYFLVWLHKILSRYLYLVWVSGDTTGVLKAVFCLGKIR